MKANIFSMKINAYNSPTSMTEKSALELNLSNVCLLSHFHENHLKLVIHILERVGFETWTFAFFSCYYHHVVSLYIE